MANAHETRSEMAKKAMVEVMIEGLVGFASNWTMKIVKYAVLRIAIDGESEYLISDVVAMTCQMRFRVLKVDEKG